VRAALVVWLGVLRLLRLVRVEQFVLQGSNTLPA
jgi:hypothetical protein